MIRTFSRKIHLILDSLGHRFELDTSYIARGMAWLNGRIIVSMIVALALSVAFANLLSPEEYGTYRFIISIVSLWGGILLSGANIAVTGAVARGAERTFNASITLQFKWNLAGVICIAGTGVYYLVQGNTNIGYPILAASLIYPISSIFNTYIAYFAGIRDFRNQSIYESIASATYVSVIFIALLLGANAGLLAVLFFLSNLIGHSFGFAKARSKVDPSTPADNTALTFAKQLTLISIPASFILQLDSIIVFHYLGSAGLAIYAFSMLGPDKLSGLLKSVSTLALSKFARRTTNQLRSSMLKRSFQFSIFAACIALAYIVAAPYIFRVFYSQYLDAVRYTQIYALSLVAAGVMLPMSSLFAQSRIRRIAATNFGLPIVQLAIIFLGVRYYGLPGAIAAKLIGDFGQYAFVMVLHQYSGPETDQIAA